MKVTIQSLIGTECPWRDTLYWYDTIDSTNTRAKQMAADGAPQGTVLIAGQQTGGRGRMGRSFHSPAGKGIYLSVILRPDCTPNQLMHLTCAVAVAACDAIETVTGFRPGIKWINDLVAGKKKLGGILTELVLDPKTSAVRAAIIGIGINCGHTQKDFPPELQDIATSLEAVTGKTQDQAALIAALIRSLWELSEKLLPQQTALMERYRKDCITLGKQVILLRGEEKRHAEALDIEDDGGLLIRLADGTTETVSSGEVSVRGMYGYS